MRFEKVNLYKEPFKDFQLGIVFSAPNQITTSGMKREYYITLSLGLWQFTFGHFGKDDDYDSKERRNILC